MEYFFPSQVLGFPVHHPFQGPLTHLCDLEAGYGGVWAPNFGGVAPGFEPRTSCLRVRSRSHYTTGAARIIQYLRINCPYDPGSMTPVAPGGGGAQVLPLLEVEAAAAEAAPEAAEAAEAIVMLTTSPKEAGGALEERGTVLKNIFLKK